MCKRLQISEQTFYRLSMSKTNTYDAGNRITNTGYTYDNLGRTKTIPNADTTGGGTGNGTCPQFG